MAVTNNDLFTTPLVDGKTRVNNLEAQAWANGVDAEFGVLDSRIVSLATAAHVAPDGSVPILHLGNRPIIEYRDGRFRFVGTTQGASLTAPVNGIVPALVAGDRVTFGQTAEGDLVHDAQDDHPRYYIQTSLGKGNVFCAYPTETGYVHQRLTQGQRYDFLSVERTLAGHATTTTNDLQRPIGFARPIKNRKPGAGLVIFIPIFGQSTAAGSPSSKPGSSITVTVAPPMPANVYMVNGGVLPDQGTDGLGANAHQAASNTTVLATNRYDGIVPAVEALQYDADGSNERASYRPYESMSTPYAAQIAASYDDDVVVVVMNMAFGASTIEEVIGDSTTKARPLLNVEAVLSRLVTEAGGTDPNFAPIHGRTVIADFACLNGFESGQSHFYSIHAPKLDNLRSRLDGLATITGQDLDDHPVRFIGMQVSAARANAEPAEVNKSSVALEQWVTEQPRHLNACVTQYGQYRDLLDESNYHSNNEEYDYTGRVAGMAAVVLDRARIYDHVKVQGATRSGSTVSVWFNRPVWINLRDTALCPGFGLGFTDDNGAVSVASFTLSRDGTRATIELATTPVGTVTLTPGTGIEHFPGGYVNSGQSRYGNGRDHGFRSNICATEPDGYSLSTGAAYYSLLTYHNPITL